MYLDHRSRNARFVIAKAAPPFQPQVSPLTTLALVTPGKIAIFSALACFTVSSSYPILFHSLFVSVILHLVARETPITPLALTSTWAAIRKYRDLSGQWQLVYYPVPEYRSSESPDRSPRCNRDSLSSLASATVVSNRHHVQGRAECQERDKRLYLRAGQGPKWYVLAYFKVVWLVRLQAPGCENTRQTPVDPVGVSPVEWRDGRALSDWITVVLTVDGFRL